MSTGNFLENSESTNLSRDNLSREIGLSWLAGRLLTGSGLFCFFPLQAFLPPRSGCPSPSISACASRQADWQAEEVGRPAGREAERPGGAQARRRAGAGAQARRRAGAQTRRRAGAQGRADVLSRRGFLWASAAFIILSVCWFFYGASFPQLFFRTCVKGFGARTRREALFMGCEIA